MKIALFLGSGVSYSSGLPSTKRITDALLHDEWHSSSDSRFYPGPEPDPGLRARNWAPCLQRFLRLIYRQANRYYQRRMRPKANYEDLYYLARQIEEEENKGTDNPAIAPFLRKVRAATYLCDLFHHNIEEGVTLGELARRSCLFIEWVVFHKLSGQYIPKGLELIKDLAQSERIEKLDIFTLNHDCLIESLLHENRIQFTDGFGPPGADDEYTFDPTFFDTDDVKVRLFKLHGSLNWARIHPVTGRYAKVLKKSKLWNLQRNLGQRPALFLVGTYNKIIDYGQGPFAQMYRRFLQLLPEHRIVVVSGYGWSDRAINTWICEWLDLSPYNCLYLLHKKPKGMLEKSRSPMWHRYRDLVNEGRLVPIPKWLSNVTLDELVEKICGTNPSIST